MDDTDDTLLDYLRRRGGFAHPPPRSPPLPPPTGPGFASWEEADAAWESALAGLRALRDSLDRERTP